MNEPAARDREVSGTTTVRVSKLTRERLEILRRLIRKDQTPVGYSYYKITDDDVISRAVASLVEALSTTPAPPSTKAGPKNVDGEIRPSTKVDRP